jgi:hypothetical protein
MTAHGFKTRLDLVELSDAFRRHAKFDNQDAVRAIVVEARKVAVLSTYYHGEHPDLPENQSNDERIRQEIIRLADLAAKLGADEVVLPHTGDQHSWNARRIQENVLNGLDLPVKMVLQPDEYKRDMSDIGRIDKRIKTALDVGIRGVMDIDQDLRLRWDNPRLPAQEL